MSACDGKVKHVTARDAMRHLLNLKRRMPRYRGMVYRCSRCGWIHVGRKRKDVRKEGDKR